MVSNSSLTSAMANDAGFARCSGPLWRVDDFNNCFQRDFLKTLLPFIVIGSSFTLLSYQAVRRYIKSKRKSNGYHAIANGNNVFGVPGHHENNASVEGEIESDEEESLTMNGGRLALAKTATRDSIAQIDRPAFQNTADMIEWLSLVALVAINITALVTHAYGSNGQLAALAGVLTWLYTMILVTLRTMFQYSKWRIPRLWNHSAVIYTCQWLFLLIVFRSVLIHPRSRLARILIITEFSLSTLLFAICISTRKGNKAVILEWEDGIEPSQEPLASIFSLATFSWVDPIVWKGFQKPFEIEDVWNLVPKDKAAYVLNDYRQLKKSGKLIWHLLRYFRWPLFKQCAWAFVSAWFTFAPTLVLKAILEYIENPEDTPRNVIWLLVILLPMADLVRSLCDQQALWNGRKTCIRLRALIIGEIYAKSLRRKAASNSDKVLGEEKANDKKSRIGKVWAFRRGKTTQSKDSKQKSAEPTAAGTGSTPGSDDTQVNVGTIINLMSVDSFKVAESTGYLHFLLSAAPTELLVCVILLYQIMGLSSIPGLIVMVFLLPVNIAFAKGFNSSQKKIMAATDKRIHTTNEILQNIRIIKFFAWENRFGKIVDEKRSDELKALRRKYIIWAFAVATWNTVPVLITFFSFLVFTKVEKRPLYPSIAFTAISLFNLLRVPLDQLGDMIAHVQESAVSVNRVEEFLNEDETEKYEQLRHGQFDEEGNEIIGFKNGTFTWGGKDAIGEDGSSAFRLMDIDIKFSIGALNIIAGQTGSGKTSLLMALLGEMTIIKGQVFLPGGYSREDVRPDPETGLTESVAYCAQSAWLVNATIKENILFAAPLDERRYKDVMVACALERDLEIFDNGDDTLVGEKGITLSGGQKQRISLARALYSNSKHLLLDDCLSAVDSHTAKWIVDNCITGPLMAHRTCILVTHNISLTLPYAKHVVVLDNGRISHQGTPDAVLASGILGEDVHKGTASGKVSRIPSRVPSQIGEGGLEAATANGKKPNGTAATHEPKPKKPIKGAMDETKAVGGVKFDVMMLYLKAMGPWWFWALSILVFGVQQLAGLAANVWIKEWANKYDIEERVKLAPNSFAAPIISTTALGGGSMIKKIGPYFDANKSSLAAMLTDDVDVNFYLGVYALIGILGMFVALFRDLWLFYGSLNASWSIHQRLMVSVSRAKFKFFDVTPLGQLMNRFSKDLEAVDQEVAPIAIGCMGCALAIVVTTVLISAITPGFLIAAVFISGLYYAVARFYIRSSRDLKRLESVHRSPLFQQFGETLSGITTIRAYGDERRFIRDNMIKVNTHNRPFISLWGANRWLAFRIDVIGDMVAFFSGMFVILSIGTIDAGSAGLALTYAIGFTENVLWLVRLYAMYEQNMNSVERIKEYLDVEQEAPAVIEKGRPAADWPSQGSIEFIDYSTRYRSDLEPVLRGVSFKIRPKEKVGIVGRTGAGKSSLALALFRGLEAETGKILIDGVDIGLIGLQDLRESITIVPQDPTLFTGTIRSNLDPFNLFTDEDIFTALRRVQLIGAPGSGTIPSTPLVSTRPSTPSPNTPTLVLPAPDSANQDTTVPPTPTTPITNKNIFFNLSFPVAESGNNLSQGQRQLLCLARAMLKNPKVLMMDEATASIDYATDNKIQDTIRELEGTVITIAHRLQTIVDYDKVLVLEAGKVVEWGHPWGLLQKGKDGKMAEGEGEAVFKGMCEMSGDFEALERVAKRKWERRINLIDIDTPTGRA